MIGEWFSGDDTHDALLLMTNIAGVERWSTKALRARFESLKAQMPIIREQWRLGALFRDGLHRYQREAQLRLGPAAAAKRRRISAERRPEALIGRLRVQVRMLAHHDAIRSLPERSRPKAITQVLLDRGISSGRDATARAVRAILEGR